MRSSSQITKYTMASAPSHPAVAMLIPTAVAISPS
jgi:hypothetical protein